MDEAEVIPAPTRWYIMRCNWQSRWWALQHWAVTHLFPLHFCHGCAGYFQEVFMLEPDTCQTCYQRNHGIPLANAADYPL